MRELNQIIRLAIAGAFAISALTACTALADDSSNSSTEKCYGIAKAGKNDCAAGILGCHGTATKDGQGDAYLLVPQGLCTRIVGGSLTPIQNN